ncbi:hypothetical protein [Sporosarcina pasteurii]|uniref:Lipoprotein n=1 Tax=Sporosarcina pasteurii TaxID=1474 RepID=A0A380C826_SPOPA|nr:hypothetical protein [Sporosarcina pasteurii]MDS9471781.1 hypothetical protein [Sporosarcina pasteurii]QBQ04625.1 hypothetical protein E2C16_02540 [Sporosarcina pasteurii]SUJ13688.1 Uncharacterised protein [Sporosarcina pasteurii]
MFQTWKYIFLVSVAVFLLTGCGKSLEDQASEGIKAAREAFHTNNKEQNEEIEGTKLYKPVGFNISDESDAQNIVLNKGKETFILFVNPNETKDSQLFYELLHANEEAHIVAEEKFSDGDTFGFAAIVNHGNGTIELIASVGGAKISTLTNEKNVVRNLEAMMQIVRSIR